MREYTEILKKKKLKHQNWKKKNLSALNFQTPLSVWCLKTHHVHRNLQMFEIVIQTQNDLKSFQAWLRPLMQQSRSED